MVSLAWGSPLPNVLLELTKCEGGGLFNHQGISLTTLGCPGYKPQMPVVTACNIPGLMIRQSVNKELPAFQGSTSTSHGLGTLCMCT